MELNSKQVLNIRKKFRTAFIASIAIVIIASVFSYLSPPEADSLVLNDGTPLISITLTQVLAVASLFTTAITGLGLIISNTIAWKKELRERDNFELDAEKKRLEIEKLRSELDALRAKGGNSAALPTRSTD